MPRSLYPFLIAPIVYYLVMSNSISSACSTDVSTALEIVFGSIVMLGSVALGVFHQKDKGDTEEAKAKFSYMKKALEAFKGFALKKPQEPPQPPQSI